MSITQGTEGSTAYHFDACKHEIVAKYILDLGVPTTFNQTVCRTQALHKFQQFALTPAYESLAACSFEWRKHLPDSGTTTGIA
eukprot:3930404-Pleurochrysis_carterae.AAC.1